MAKEVKKSCSILNYIRHADENLYELIQDLCLGRMLVPRRGSPGITFLRPDKNLFKELHSMATGDDPEKAVEALQSMVLLDNLSSVGEFDDKKSDIPTFLRQKLPVASADSRKVVLTNGAEITPDKDFASRSDRSNINVYILSKALVPAKTSDADFSQAKVKTKKKGGADLGTGRQDLFTKVVESTAKGESEPAMDILVEMYVYFKSVKQNEDIANTIRSQCSYDALASLAIVLQPFKKSDNKYISDGELSEFINYMYQTPSFKADDAVWSIRDNVAGDYDTLVKTVKTEYAALAARVTGDIAKMKDLVSKPTIVKKLNEYYSSIATSNPLPGKRVGLNKHELFAEAELRVLSAITQDSSSHNPSKEELMDIFKNCTLDKPFMCGDASLMKDANIGFYYSTVYLIARSDALLYMPGAVTGGKPLKQIFLDGDGDVIDISGDFAVSRQDRRAKSAERAAAFIKRVGAAAHMVVS